MRQLEAMQVRGPSAFALGGAKLVRCQQRASAAGGCPQHILPPPFRPQSAASEQASAWREAERGLQERLKGAEAAAVAAASQAAQQGRELEDARQQLAAATAQVRAGWGWH